MTPSSDLRAAIVGGYNPDSWAGPLKATAGMLRNLPRHGIDVELWQFRRDAKEVAWQEIDGIKMLSLPRRSKFSSFLVGLTDESKEAIRARLADVDLVHFNSVFIADNVHAALLLDVPYIISPRGGYNRSVLRGTNRFAKTIWMAARERRYISNARVLHAVSPSEALELQNLVPTESIISIPNAIEEQILDRPMKEPMGKKLLFLGRLAVEHKGIDLLLAGYHDFLQVGNDTTSELVMAGPDFRGDLQTIQELISSLGLDDRVTLPGGIFGDEKWSLIDQAYAFVLTSRWEGMPFSLLEALAAGRPALVTPGTNLGDAIAEYGAGLLVEGTPQDIARGIKALLHLSADEYRKMQNQARRLIRDKFLWDRVAGDLAASYRRIVGDRRAL